MCNLKVCCILFFGPIFWLGHLFFWNWAAGVACIFLRLVVCQLLHLLLFSPLLIRAPVLSDQGSTVMASFNLNHLLKTLQFGHGSRSSRLHYKFLFSHSVMSLPIPCLWVIPVHQPRASCIMHWVWSGDSFHIWYYTCLNAILPNPTTLALSHRIQKTVLYICISFAVLHTGLSLPSF